MATHLAGGWRRPRRKLYSANVRVRCTPEEHRAILSSARRANRSASRFLVELGTRSPEELLAPAPAPEELQVLDREAGVLTHNLPEPVRDAPSYEAVRENLIAYAEMREELEVAQHRSRGEPRTHYRALMSFERDVPTEKALRMTREWLEKEVPRARAFAMVHRDTEHVHVHVWIEARQADGRKLHLSREEHRALGRSWDAIYARELGRPARETQREREVPDRVRKQGRELAPHFERREIGVHAAKTPGLDRSGETFLERVRSVVGPDLREARSWGELERRLERHGLRVEPRGRGMVITDGRQQVKASAVDRSASRGSLEKRFGAALPDHIRERSARAALSPQVQLVVEQVRGLDRRVWLDNDMARAVQEREAARARLESFAWARQRAAAAVRTMDAALAHAFRSPRDARTGIETMARERGIERTVEEVRSRAEQFGQLRPLEQRRLFGLIGVGGHRQSQERIAGVSEAVREALDARAAVPHERLVEQTERQVRHAEERVNAVERQLGREPERTHTLARIGAAAMQVDRAGARELKEALSRAEFHAIATARQTMQQVTRRLSRSLVPDQAREVAAWATAPQKQLPRAVVRAIRDMALDRERDRGLA
jgi:hypothetical protein